MKRLLSSITFLVHSAAGIVLPLMLLSVPFHVNADDRPNIVLVMVDDMGYSDIGCYGGEIPTPNIDRLAKGGIRFSQFYNTSRCCPTRASLLTGLYQHQTGVGHMMSEGRFNFDYGVDGYRGQLNRGCVTLAEVLRSAGYHTYMAGKWHLGDDMDDRPMQRGFDKFYGSLSGAFSYFMPHGDRHLMEGNEALPPPNPKTYYTTDAFAEKAVDWIEEQEDDKPFFLYLAFNAPHWPLHAKQEDIEKFEGKYLKGWDVLRQERFQRQVEMGLFDKSLGVSPRDSNVRPWGEVPEDQKIRSDYRMAVYAAQVNCVDQNVGKLLAALEKEEKLNNTLILFLSDNGACAEPYSEFGGGEFSSINDPNMGGAISVGRGWANLSNTPFREYKNRPQEGGIATPFIAHWPEGIQKKLRGDFVRDVAHIIDVMPTLIDLSGASYPTIVKKELIPEPEGMSLLPIFQKGKRIAPEYLFWEHELNCAVRSGNWKAVSVFGEYDWELYNLKTDRNELENVADKHPEIVQRLDQAWRSWALHAKAAPKGRWQDRGYKTPKE
jgi:arylsulfatase A-like enzyme